MAKSTRAYSITLLKKKQHNSKFNIDAVEIREPKTRVGIVQELEVLLGGKLYVPNWQAYDLFSYSLLNQRQMINNKKRKPSDYQIFRLLVAYYKGKPIAWLVVSKWTQTLWRDDEVWQYTKRHYRKKGIAKLLSIKAGYDKRMYEKRGSK